VHLVQNVYIVIVIIVGNKNTLEHTICLGRWLHKYLFTDSAV